MEINSARLIYFSPTQTTQQVVEGIARAFPVYGQRLDLTPPAAETLACEPMRGELAIIGAPVYGGRIPVEAVRRLRRLRAHDSPAVVVVVYGNREYEDALLELKDIAEAIGCVPIAGAAFIGENTANYALDAGTPLIASGRPDAEDLRRARAFGAEVWRKVMDARTLATVPPLQVPGHHSYAGGSSPKAAPATEESACTLCGTCAAVCPTAAVTVGDGVVTDREACILPALPRAGGPPRQPGRVRRAGPPLWLRAVSHASRRQRAHLRHPAGAPGRLRHRLWLRSAR